MTILRMDFWLSGLRTARSDRRAGGHRRWLHIGYRCVGWFFENHRFPRCGFGDELAQQLVVELVAGLVAAELADEAVAEKIEIADRVEDLVLDEFVFVPKSILVEDAEIIQHDGIVEIAAERQISRAHHLE